MENEQTVYAEEQGVSFLDILKVLFGRPLLLLIITFGVAFVGSVGSYFYNRFTKSYESRFHFSEEELNGDEPKNLNDTRFEVRNYFDLEALISYKENDESLAKLDVDAVINNNGIEEVKWDAIEEFNIDTNTSRILQQDYKVIFKKSNFSFDEAKAVVKMLQIKSSLIMLNY